MITNQAAVPCYVTYDVQCFVILSVCHMRERESDDANSTMWASGGLQVSEKAEKR